MVRYIQSHFTPLSIYKLLNCFVAVKSTGEASAEGGGVIEYCSDTVH
jgi:hypothetical protein